MKLGHCVAIALTIPLLSGCRGASTPPNVQATVDAAVLETLAAPGDAIDPSTDATSAPTALPAYSIAYATYGSGPTWLIVPTRVTTGPADSDHAGYRETVLEYDLINAGHRPQLLNVSNRFGSGLFSPTATDSRAAAYSCSDVIAAPVGGGPWGSIGVYIPVGYFVKFQVTCAIANTAQDAQIQLKSGAGTVTIPLPLDIQSGDTLAQQNLNPPAVTSAWRSAKSRLDDHVADPQFAEATLESLTLSEDRSTWIATIHIKNLYGSDMGPDSVSATLYSDSLVSSGSTDSISIVAPGSEADWHLEFPAAGDPAVDHLLVLTVSKPNLEIAGQLLFWMAAP